MSANPAVGRKMKKKKKREVHYINLENCKYDVGMLIALFFCCWSVWPLRVLIRRDQ